MFFFELFILRIINFVIKVLLEMVFILLDSDVFDILWGYIDFKVLRFIYGIVFVIELF